MEHLEHGLPFEEYARDSAKLRKLVGELDKEYDKREKIIERIIEYGTGIEDEKALRMYSIPVLEKWEAALESFREKELSSGSGDSSLKADVANLRAQMDRLRADAAHAGSEERAKIQHQVDALHAKLHEKLATAERRSAARKETAKARVSALERKENQRRARAKASVDARIAKIRNRTKKKA